MPRRGLRADDPRLATASVDVSDGLIADLGHIARASGVGIEIDLEPTPLSAGGPGLVRRSGRSAGGAGEAGRPAATTTRSPSPPRRQTRRALRREAERQHLRLTRIGRVTAGTGVTARYRRAGRDLAEDAGLTHG